MNDIKLINRTKCCITGIDDIESLIKIPSFPIYSGCTNGYVNDDVCADMEWGISKTSGIIQLMHLIPEAILYAHGHGSGSVGATWQRHHKAFADFIKKYHPRRIFEIGGGHGLLAKYYGIADSWIILEPAPNPVDGTPAEYIKGYFDEKFHYDKTFDAFVHSHTFEHVYQPVNFMRTLNSFIPNGKFLFFSLPNLDKWTKLKFSNNIGWEHTIMLTEPYIDYLLGTNGFRLLEKTYFEGHSIFYAAVRDDQTENVALPLGLYASNKSEFLAFFSYYKDLCDNLNKQMDKYEKVYLFGAHIFAQFLISMGLNVSKIKSLLDNDENKQGKRLYGTNLMVYSPKLLKDVENPVVIVKAGAYTDEIKMDIIENINKNTVFLD